ncbi:MAG: toprim domain-containing protein, partial [Planctomycetaceae bacterium]|nr:toprim domain-containing protein [Planctomycetaceae bacterium]
MYPLQNEQGDVLTWFGRDLRFSEKLSKWQRDGGNADDKPAKIRFVSGFRRGSELFGQHGSQRLKADPQLRDWLQTVGLLVVEGANDVIRLDTDNAAAVGLLSNAATDQQIQKIIRFARTAHSRVILLPDNDREGEDGFMRLHWHLSGVSDLETRLGWSRQMYNGRFAGRQPESITPDEWTFLKKQLVR